MSYTLNGFIELSAVCHISRLKCGSGAGLKQVEVYGCVWEYVEETNEVAGNGCRYRN